MLSFNLTEFSNAANWNKLPPEIPSAEFSDTANSINFPGALLPAVAADGRIFWYAVASNAKNWRSVLRGEWRLDEHNLIFAEVRLLWAFRDWTALASAPWLPSLVYIQKPASIARMLMEALWRNYLEPAEQDASQLKEIYKAD